MPVGGAHRGIWKSSGGLGTSDTFNRPNGALGSTDGGNILSWQTVKGTWSISANRPTTSDSRDTNPMAVVDAASPDVDVKVDTSSGGGDALYFRVADANNWLRLRVDNTTFSSTYSYACAYTTSFTCYSSSAYTCFATSYCPQYSSSCSPNGTYASGYLSETGSGTACSCHHFHSNYTCYSTSASSCCGGSYSHNHYTNCTNNCITDTTTHTHTMGVTYNGATGSYVACGSYSYTCYSQVSNTCYSTAFQTCYATAYAAEPQTILDKNVGGTISTIATYPANPTSLRAVTDGSSVTPMINNAAQAVQTVADHQAATKHGFGRGPSANNGTAIDNFDLSTS